LNNTSSNTAADSPLQPSQWVAPSPWSWGRFGLLLLGFLLLRSLVTFPAENVDAMIKYDVAAHIVRSGDWSALLRDQHTLRWSQTLPQVLVTWLTGFRYEGMYLLPLLAFAASSALLLTATWNLFGAAERLALAGLLFIEPLALNHTGQLLNPPFGVMFVLIAVLLLTRQQKPSAGMLAAAALMLFAAYGSHVTYLAFAGAACGYLLLRRLPVHALALAGSMLVLLGLETLLFNALSGDELSFGRIQALAQSSHVAAVDNKFPTLETGSMFLRWLHLPAFNQLLVAGFLGLAGWQFWQRRRSQGRAQPLPAFITCSMLSAAAYGLAVTFAVIDINPLKPLLPVRNMYLEVFMPFATLATVTLASRLVAGWSARSKLLVAAAGAALVGSLFLLMVQGKGALRDTINARVSAFVWNADRDLGDYSRRFADGRLLIRGPNVKAMLLLAQYQNPVEFAWQKRPVAVGARNLQADALCVANLRRQPVQRNYQNCRRFVEPKRGRFTLLLPQLPGRLHLPDAQSSIMRDENSG
jgi:hypothetical protein